MKPIEKLLIPLFIIILIVIIPLAVLESAYSILARTLIFAAIAHLLAEYELVAIAIVFAALTAYAYHAGYLGSHRLFFSVFGILLIVAPFIYKRLLTPVQSELLVMLAIVLMEAVHFIFVHNKLARVAYLVIAPVPVAIMLLFPFQYLEFPGYAVFVASFIVPGATKRISVSELNLSALNHAAHRATATGQSSGAGTAQPVKTASRAKTRIASISQVPGPLPTPVPAPPPKQTPAEKQGRLPSLRGRLRAPSVNKQALIDDSLPANVPWPTQSDYSKAMQNIEFSVNTAYPEMRKSRVIPNPFVKLAGNIIYSSGNYGTVFKLESDNAYFALKCFTRSKPDLNRRYSAISKTLKAVSSYDMAFVDFQYLPKAVRTLRNPSTFFPALMMDWVEGTNLNVFISEHLKKKDAIERVAGNFLDEMIKIRGAGIAHGDIAGDNIVISDSGKLMLVDYDGMYVHEFRGMKSEEIGHDNFQHPGRTSSTYSERLDNFSILVVYLSMLAVSDDASVWSRYNKGDQDCLIFRKSDFTDPANSGVIAELARAKGTVGDLTKMLTEALNHDPLWEGCDPQSMAKLSK